MVSLDAAELTTRELNTRLKELAEAGAEITVINPRAHHNIAVGILSPASLGVALRNFAQAIVGAVPPPDELEIRTRGGATRYVEANIKVFRSRGVPTEVQVIFRDVTERRRGAAAVPRWSAATCRGRCPSWPGSECPERPHFCGPTRRSFRSAQPDST